MWNKLMGENGLSLSALRIWSKKYDVGLGSTEVEKKAMSNDMSSIMGIVQVHTQMNLVHD